MKYRLLALDLDGTLLRGDGHVDERDRGAIAELRRAGVTVTIATGRLHSGSVGAARACGIAGAIACVEGSHLVDVESRETIASHALAAGSIEVLRGALAEHGLASFVFGADGIHHDAAGAPFAGYVGTWSPNLVEVEHALAPGAWANAPLAAVAIGDPAQVAAAHDALRPHAAQIFAVSFALSSYFGAPGKHAILARAAGPSKGTALAALCSLAGCTPAEAVAVGDWFNDVPMFEVAGRSFAMAGAPDAVRAKATDALVRAAGAGGGIAEAIQKAWG